MYFFERDDQGSCTPENITGFSFQLRIVKSNCVVVLVNGTIVDPTNGVLFFEIDPALHLESGENLASLLVTDTSVPANTLEYMARDKDKLVLCLED